MSYCFGNIKISQVTEKYKSSSGTGRSLIESKNDGLLYAVSRMPATYSVILTLLNQLNKQETIDDFSSVIDVGCGTGDMLVPIAKQFSVSNFIVMVIDASVVVDNILSS